MHTYACLTILTRLPIIATPTFLFILNLYIQIYISQVWVYVSDHQWRRNLKLSGESAVEKITLDGLKGLRVMLSATAHDILYYRSLIYCHIITNSVSGLYISFNFFTTTEVLYLSWPYTLIIVVVSFCMHILSSIYSKMKLQAPLFITWKLNKIRPTSTNQLPRLSYG